MSRRLLVALPLLAFAAFCVFGFLAGYEPPGWPMVRAAYAGPGTLCVLGAGRAPSVRAREAPKPSE